MEQNKIVLHGGEKKFAIVSLPVWYGAGKPGTESGPEAFQEFGLDDKLRAQGVKVVGWYQAVPDPIKSTDAGSGKVKYEKEIFHSLNSAFRLIRILLQDGVIPIVLGGDHTISIASVGAQASYVGGAPKVGVIWFDAHGDVHTHETSPSGNAHGMPLALLLGHGSEQLTDVGGEFRMKAYPHNVVHLGSNSVEPAEIEFFSKHHIPYFSKKDLDTDEGFERAKNSIVALGKSVEAVNVSIDADVFDQKDAPGVHYRNPDGSPKAKIFELLRHTKKTCCVGGIDVAELIREKDIDSKTVALLHEALLCLLV